MLGDTQKIKEMIEDAQMILAGIGEEYRIPREQILQENEIYRKWIENDRICTQEEQNLIFDSIYLHELEGGRHPLIQEKIKFYENLRILIGEKEHFVVSLCEDGLLEKTSATKIKYVCPCGEYAKLQCTSCQAEVRNGRDAYDSIYRSLENWMQRDGDDISEIIRNLPHCTCGAVMQANVAEKEHYNETGYLADWQEYTKWLSRTLNKKVCMLEFGVGFKYPTVIRWPFEKVATLNQKAILIRMHETLYQTAKEIEERSFSLRENGEKWIQEVIDGRE